MWANTTWCVGYDTWSTFFHVWDMHICVHACYPGMGICVHMEVWAWSWESFLINLPPYSLRQVLCVKPRTWQYRRCHLWNYKAVTMPMWHLHGLWGSEIQIPCFLPGISLDSGGLNSVAVLLMWQVMNHRAIPQPMVCIFNNGDTELWKVASPIELYSTPDTYQISKIFEMNYGIWTTSLNVFLLTGWNDSILDVLGMRYIN